MATPAKHHTGSKTSAAKRSEEPVADRRESAPLASVLQQRVGNSAVEHLLHHAEAPAAQLMSRTDNDRAVSEAITVARSLNPVVQRAPGPLTPQQESAAVAFNRARYDKKSVRVIQNVVGTSVDGDFGAISAEAVATFQGAQALGQTGQVDQGTLDAVVVSAATTNDEDYAIYAVADFFAINTAPDTLSVRFDSALAANSATAFEPGGLRVITIGSTAMGSSATISTEIRLRLAVPAPAAAAPGAAPTLLTAQQESAAVASDRKTFTDVRSVRAIQAAVGAAADGIWSADTVERVAGFQHTMALVEDGVIGRMTLHALSDRWTANNEQESAIRAIVDFYDLNQDALVDVSFESGMVPSNAETGSNAIPGDSVVHIGPGAFAQGFAGLVHTIAHEFEHVRQRRVGIQNQHLREFLGERIEIRSAHMDPEELAGFMDDAGRALQKWNAMPPDLQRANFPKFEDVRAKVRARLAAASFFGRLPHLGTLASYEGVVRP